MISEKMRTYELIVVFNPNAQESMVNERITKIEEIVKKHSGEITSKEIWGKRSLAYPVKNYKYGLFIVLTIHSEGSVVSEINRMLRISDEVLRNTLVTKDKYSPDLEGRLKGDFTYGYKPPHAQFNINAGAGDFDDDAPVTDDTDDDSDVTETASA
jgi:small subunit ribosomal protein S6